MPERLRLKLEVLAEERREFANIIVHEQSRETGNAPLAAKVHGLPESSRYRTRPMRNFCIVVTDSGRARIFLAEDGGKSRAPLELVERDALDNPDLSTRGRSVTGRPRTETNTNREAGPVHPIGAQRERHRVELESRFGQQIARRAAEITRDWREGAVVLVAEPRQLGLMREPLRHALHRGIELKELATDYTHLTSAELLERLILNSLLPARRGGVQ